MLTERERRLLAQMEAHLHRDEPGLVHLFAHGRRPRAGRLRRLPNPEPATALAMIFTGIVMVVGFTLIAIGLRFQSPSLLSVALPTLIVLPLPVWLVTNSRRWIDYFGLAGPGAQAGPG